MTYKNRFIFLVSIITLLALAYTASYVFSPERRSAKSASFIWLETKIAAKTSKIVINTEVQTIELLKQNNLWFVSSNGNLYPANMARIEDFIGIFTARSAWPVRSSGASLHERFGLNEDTASRVTIYGENTVLLDVLCGKNDTMGHEIFLRKYAGNEVRSGSDSISLYIDGPVDYWFNLALIPKSADGKPDINSVQRLTVYNGTETQVFSRKNREWAVSGINVENPDQNKIENYVRIVLDTEGDDFIDSVFADNYVFGKSRVVFEFGDGRVVTIQISEPDGTGRCLVQVTGSEYFYSVPAWASMRIFRDAASFEK